MKHEITLAMKTKKASQWDLFDSLRFILDEEELSSYNKAISQ